MSSWELVSPYIIGRKVLDVGCSDGLYLKYMSADSVGIEQISALAEAGRSKGLNIINGDVYKSICKLVY